MTSTGKQRLIGFLVIAALGVIFLPMLFDGAGYSESKHFRVDTPTAPEPIEFKNYPTQKQQLTETKAAAEPRPQPKDQQTEVVKESEPAKPVVVTKTEPKVEDKPVAETASSSKPVSDKSSLSLDKEKPVLDKQGVPVAWTLQLAAFQDKTNAKELNKKLLDKGYKAYVRTKDNLYKVYVGPDVQRTEIETLRAQLKREFKLDGLILRFTTS